jgi:2-C-methyl-D-erythritol 4-phosphate cytidylyltransferase/2-C-methyl-D-erythritol 2,4-cyclodiphosphate synthase
MASLGASEATALTDDAAVAERAGLKVVMVSGSEDNAKITTTEDLLRAAVMETRTAFGFDVHGFGPGNAVMLGGVAIPHTQGLAGHSDADVALHALTDAVLGTSAPATSASAPSLRPAMARPRPTAAPRRRTAGGARRVSSISISPWCAKHSASAHRAVMVANRPHRRIRPAGSA